MRILGFSAFSAPLRFMLLLLLLGTLRVPKTMNRQGAKNHGLLDKFWLGDLDVMAARLIVLGAPRLVSGSQFP